LWWGRWTGEREGDLGIGNKGFLRFCSWIRMGDFPPQLLRANAEPSPYSFAMGRSSARVNGRRSE